MSFVIIGVPIILFPPNNQKLVKNNINFHCFAVGYPRPNITWLKNGIILTNSDSNMINEHKVGDCESTMCGLLSTMWILSATIYDCGTYTCIATNFAGSDARSAQLTCTGNNYKYYMHVLANLP